MKESLRSVFVKQWESECSQNRKLGFHNSIKTSIGSERYLGVELNYQQAKRIAQVRTSSHRFNIETGRHGNTNRSAILNRMCPHCNDTNALRYLVELPFQDSELVLEDELHVLHTCPKKQRPQTADSESVKTCLNEDPGRLFAEQSLSATGEVFGKE